ncbi:MAG: hypothetical protein GVY08_14180 [Bacteroidetes bacterium]|nr:hypothetical protein [Bacteroidota bacterium]
MARKLMITSGLANGIAGILLTFIPEELLMWADGTSGEGAILLVSLLGVAMLGIGMLNYMGKNAIYGGIYGKPILMCNLIFHSVTALNLIKFSIGSEFIPSFYPAITGGIYLLFAAGFIRLNFFPPDIPRKIHQET